MRFLAKVTFPHEPFNTYVKDGSIGDRMMGILHDLKPDAAYFTEMGGKRTGIFIVNLTQESQMPGIAEPFFVIFGADFEWHPAMVPDDLGKSGLAEMAKKFV